MSQESSLLTDLILKAGERDRLLKLILEELQTIKDEIRYKDKFRR